MHAVAIYNFTAIISKHYCAIHKDCKLEFENEKITNWQPTHFRYYMHSIVWWNASWKLQNAFCKCKHHDCVQTAQTFRRAHITNALTTHCHSCYYWMNVHGEYCAFKNFPRMNLTLSYLKELLLKAVSACVHLHNMIFSQLTCPLHVYVHQFLA